jgi:hypothetical protein
VAESLSKAIQQLAERAAKIPPVPDIDHYTAAAFEEAGR